MFTPFRSIVVQALWQRFLFSTCKRRRLSLTLIALCVQPDALLRVRACAFSLEDRVPFFPFSFCFLWFLFVLFGGFFFLVKLEADGAVPRRFPLTSRGMPRFNLEINASNAAPK